VVQRLIAKDGFGPTSGDRTRHSQLIESELVDALQFDRVVDPTLHATLWMHDPERGPDGLGGGSIEVHPDCRLANVIGVQTSWSSDEIQGAIEAVGIGEGDDTGDRRGLNRRRDHDLRVEEGSRGAGGVCVPSKSMSLLATTLISPEGSAKRALQKARA
jgi:hypothetical protein